MKARTRMIPGTWVNAATWWGAAWCLLLPGCALARSTTGGPVAGKAATSSSVAARPPAAPCGRQGQAPPDALRPPASQPVGTSPDENVDEGGGAGVVPGRGDQEQKRQQERLQELRRLIAEQVGHPQMNRARVSLQVSRLGQQEPPLVAIDPEIPRLPASNAKLLTTTAAALTLAGRYRFVTEVSVRRIGGPLYLWGSGDPVLSRADLDRLAAAVRAAGVGRVREIVVEDRALGSGRLAPGFEVFDEGAHYRPTSGALNVDGNAVVVQVSAPPGRRRPRVDIFPPSDYVKVAKGVTFARQRRKGVTPTVPTRIRVRRRPRGSIMWLDITGIMDRGARPWSMRLAVYDPALNAGWALRRALKKAGVQVEGTVRRGRRPAGGRVVARREHSLARIILETNRDSHNLAAENLVRAMGCCIGEGRGLAARGGQGERCEKGAWERGLRRLAGVLSGLGLSGFQLGNGSGLHRRSRVTARLMVELLQKVHAEQSLRRLILPSLPVAGRSGTLVGSLRGSAAEGVIWAKTGTLDGALALSGYADPEGKAPLVFSLLVNGRSDRVVREHMERIALLLARYARGLPLKDMDLDRPEDREQEKATDGQVRQEGPGLEH